MSAYLPRSFPRRDRSSLRPDIAAALGLLIGLVMPVAAAWLYPTYVHFMPDPVAEGSRLLELPFVIAEALVIGLALARGMELRALAGSLPKDCLIAGALLMIGVWGSTLLVSQVPSTSVAISASTVIHLLFGLSVFHLLNKRRSQVIERFGASLALGLVALTVLTAWRFMLPPDPSEVPGGVIEWASALPGFISVRHFGSWTGALTAFFAVLILCRGETARLGWRDCAFTLAMGLTIWSGTRAAILALVVTGAVLACSSRSLVKPPIIGRLAALTTIAFGAAYLLRLDDPAFFLFREGTSTSNLDGLSSGRLSMWLATFQQWQLAPWFGWGSGSTFWEVYINWPHTQPHNFILQFLISWGIVGTCGALWLLGRALLVVHRRALARPQLWPLNAALYSLIVMATLEGMLHYPRFIMLIVALIAMIVRLGGADRQQLAEPLAGSAS